MSAGGFALWRSRTGGHAAYHHFYSVLHHWLLVLLSLSVSLSLLPLSFSFCLCSCSPHSSNPLLAPLCAGTPSNYLTTTLKQTNICLEAGPDPGRCLPAANTPATASLTPPCPDQTQAHHTSDALSHQENCMFARRQ